MASQHKTERRLGRPPDVDSAATRKRLVTAARAAFARDGYGHATNLDIATAAGVTPAAIYHYFPSKADLYVAVLEEVQQRIQAGWREVASEHGPLLDRLDAMLASAVEVNRRDPTEAAFAMSVHTEVQLHPELGDPFRELRRRSTDVVAVLVTDAVRNGELPQGVDPQAVEDLIHAVFSGLRRLSATPDRHAAAVELLRRMLADGGIGAIVPQPS